MSDVAAHRLDPEAAEPSARAALRGPDGPGRDMIGPAVKYIVLSLAAFVSVFPFFWMLVGTTNSSYDIVRGKAWFGDQLLVNLGNLIEQVDLPRVLFNSFYIAIISTVATLLVSSLAGYAFEIFRHKWRERIFAALLLMLSIPFAALMVPLFVMMASAGLINTYSAIILPTIANIFIIFYFRQATKAFPHELRDAAKIDGLKEWQIFLRVYMPVMRSTYAAATIIVFTLTWNNYLWPLIVLQTNDMKTMVLTISSLNSAYTPDFGVIMVATVITTLPTLIIFFLLQRLFVQGMLGSVK
ncbi:carbohydrate ABC transporter permease [Wenxinia saemankumensis]|uniref:Lactose ABC transporter membrane protein n=1 Tax=Wenxinia saemankumensis TaxID=1447782 RepID=A0A1M6AN22_9RHOB|nr:carbohydrate ABC transporter permease [Wenxinia saemankumensis]SHI37865.1 lactose ABC transporter membrane protein [Wenxinia saemankumensis]